MLRCQLGLLACVLGAVSLCAQTPLDNINEYGPPEFGHGLKEKDALDGWISLFDGKTSFGWSKATLEAGQLRGGTCTSAFGSCAIKGEVARAGTLLLGHQKLALTEGKFEMTIASTKPGAIQLADGLAIRTLVVKPDKMQSLFNGKDLSIWKRIDHAKLPKERWPSWTIKEGALHALGGPGCVEYQGKKFGDMILQVEARMNVRHANGGLFFRAIPGDFMNGYEAQLFNRCLDNDPGKPATWATGAIDDRQNTRRLVSRDGQWFVQTVIAHGPHIATWVNGYQTVDWTDTRAKHDNPRRGLRLEPGVIQLQAHDAGTDIEFRKVAARSFD